MGSKAKASVPFLVEAFEEGLKLKKEDPRNIWSIALEALGEMGAEAKAAIPAVKRVLDDPKSGPVLRDAAERALVQIQGKKTK